MSKAAPPMFTVVIAMLLVQSHAATPNVARDPGNNLLDTPRPTEPALRKDAWGVEEGAGATFCDPVCGTCTEVQSGPGCSIPELEECVCAKDPYCCDVDGGAWDVICVDHLVDCDATCFLEEAQECSLSCGVPHINPGCQVAAIEDCVCSNDPFCCNNTWDALCVQQVWESPCHVDCDCVESNEEYRGGSRLPAYWLRLANACSIDIDTSLLGFNCLVGKWCYDMSDTCIQWGESNVECDDSSFACAGHFNTPPTVGYGGLQIDMIAEMISMGDQQHYTCPACTNTTTCPSGAARGTGSELTAMFTDCECGEHYTGDPVPNGGYWWNVASDLGLNPALVSQHAGHWYYNGVLTCVAMGSYGVSCDDIGSVCAAGDEYGSGFQQLQHVIEANNNGGVHEDCPP